MPKINRMLAYGCLAAVLIFQQSTKLAAAYGIAVTGTMAITSILFYIVARHTWGWSRWTAGGLLALFLLFDIPFLLANLHKFFDGGYVPMLIAVVLITGMLIWSQGRTSLVEKYANRYPTFEQTRPIIDRWLATRVPGTAVFVSPSADHVAPILVHHVQRSRSLHETVILLTVETPPVPTVAEDARWRISSLGDGFYRLVVAFGYMEQPLLLPVLSQATKASGLSVDLTETTFYVGYETILVRDQATIYRLPEAVFSYLNRNAVREEERYGMPPDQVVEIGTQLHV